ncbi:radical SAM protein [Deferribacteres bacterium DY0037]
MQNKYTILPFNFIRQNDNILVTNDIGEHHILPNQEFNQYITGTLPVDSGTAQALESKFFLTSSQISENLIEHYAKRYRTKKRFLFDSTALHMVVLTYRCNQSCRYCHASAILKNDTSESDMSIETAKKTVDFILSSPSPYIKIEFQGGEPTLNFEVLEFIVDYAKEKKPESLTLDFVVCTNLYDLKDEHIEFCHFAVQLTPLICRLIDPLSP